MSDHGTQTSSPHVSKPSPKDVLLGQALWCWLRLLSALKHAVIGHLQQARGHERVYHGLRYDRGDKESAPCSEKDLVVLQIQLLCFEVLNDTPLESQHKRRGSSKEGKVLYC